MKIYNLRETSPFTANDIYLGIAQCLSKHKTKHKKIEGFFKRHVDTVQPRENRLNDRRIK